MMSLEVLSVHVNSFAWFEMGDWLMMNLSLGHGLFKLAASRGACKFIKSICSWVRQCGYRSWNSLSALLNVSAKQNLLKDIPCVS